MAQETEIQLQLSKAKLTENSSELCKQENKSQSFDLFMEWSLLVAPRHMNTSSTWMAVSVSAWENTAVIITTHVFVDHFGVLFCMLLFAALTKRPLLCWQRFALHYYVSFVPMMFIFSQVSRWEYMAYKLHAYSDKNLCYTSKLYFKYAPQILLWKIQGSLSENTGCYEWNCNPYHQKSVRIDVFPQKVLK